MKLFALFTVASAFNGFGPASINMLANKKPNKQNTIVDKGPRECQGDKLSDSPDGSTLWKCKSRNPDNKNPHLTKRCKLKCKKGKVRSGNKKVYCKSGHYWVLRKDEARATPGKCV